MPSPSFPVPVLQGGRMSVPVVFQRFNRGEGRGTQSWEPTFGKCEKMPFLGVSRLLFLYWNQVFGFSERGGHSGGCLTFLMYKYHMVPCWEFHWTCTIDLKQFRVAKLLTLGHVGGESFLSMISTFLSNSSWLCYWTIACTYWTHFFLQNISMIHNMVSKLGCPQVGQLDFEPSLATGRFVAYVFIPYYPPCQRNRLEHCKFLFHI